MEIKYNIDTGGQSHDLCTILILQRCDNAFRISRYYSNISAQKCQCTLDTNSFINFNALCTLFTNYVTFFPRSSIFSVTVQKLSLRFCNLSEKRSAVRSAYGQHMLMLERRSIRIVILHDLCAILLSLSS